MRTCYFNGRFHSLDVTDSQFTALLCEDGVILKTGSDDEILELAGDSLRVNLTGRNVLPGFIDTHHHLIDNAIDNSDLLKHEHLLLFDACTLDELVEITRKYIEDNHIPEGEWVTGFGWDQEIYGELPTCLVLDRISTKHPIMLDRRCGTITAVNSLAMELSGVDKNTPDPIGGELVRFEDGSPTGLMLESAMSLIGDHVPKVTDKQVIKKMLQFSMQHMIENGITVSHTEDFYSVGDRNALWEAYLELQAEGKMPLNLVLQLRIHRENQLHWYTDLGFHSWDRYGRITIGPLKILSDGSLGGWSAGLTEPYSDKPDTKGYLYWTDESIRRICRKIVDAGFDLTTHAIGDAGVERFLDGCLSVKDDIVKRGLRPSVIHSQIMNDRIFDKYLQVGATALIQPMYIHSDWQIADARVGNRMRTSYNYGTMLKMGIHLAAGSDMPIESVNPFEGMQVLITRKDLAGKPEGGWYPEERFSRLDALRMYTTFGAYVSHDEHRFGSLEVGKRANFVVVSGDMFHVPEDEIKNIEVLETYVDGDCVYSRI